MVGSVIDNSLTRGNKQEITNWGMPDLDAGISISSPYTIPCDGYLYMSTYSGSQRWNTDPDAVGDKYWVCGIGTITGATWNIIRKGTTIMKESTGNGQDDVAIFYPCIGG